MRDAPSYEHFGSFISKCETLTKLSKKAPNAQTKTWKKMGIEGPKTEIDLNCIQSRIQYHETIRKRMDSSNFKLGNQILKRI